MSFGFNALVKIYTVSGSADNKQYTLLVDSVRAFIKPASDETLALYPDLPVGKSYQFVIYDISDLKDGDEIEIVNDDGCELEVGSKLLVQGFTIQKVMGRKIISGVGVKLN